MIDPFERGKAWFIYNKLEREFIETTSYVAFETVHNDVSSEKFGELLIKIGGSVSSFFDLMVDSKSLDDENSVKELREKIKEKREKLKKRSEWSPTITDFRKAFNSVFQLSSAEVEAAYGLTYYGILQPFEGFTKKSPPWWEPYNKVKHQFFEKIEEKARLKHTVNALAALFILNVLHRESRKYLIRYTNVISGEYMSKADVERFLSMSFVGAPCNVASKFVAVTPLFNHSFRIDKNVRTR